MDTMTDNPRRPSSDITIAPATATDVPALVLLLEEMNRFYGEETIGDRTTRIGRLEATLFGPQPAAYLLLAHNDKHVHGLASYSYLWPAAGITRSLYLKELYIAEEARGHGIGRLLMHRLHTIAHETNCSRIEWTTDHDNKEAQAFYTRMGYDLRVDKVMYRLPVNH
jgi:GNAT superfamily N-acetyltransferase